MKSFRSKYLEINIAKKQHLALEFKPYGFGYDKPLIILKLFIISFYITLPFYIKKKDSDISYGFYFYDLDQKHWLPDCLVLAFGKHTKYLDMPWLLKLFDVKYESNISKGNLHIKDIDKNDRIFKQNATIISRGERINLKYYKEIRILKYKIFGKFIDLGKKDIYVLNVDYDKPNYDLSDKGRTGDMMFLNENESAKQGFERYCKENNIILA